MDGKSMLIKNACMTMINMDIFFKKNIYKYILISYFFLHCMWYDYVKTITSLYNLSAFYSLELKKMAM